MPTEKTLAFLQELQKLKEAPVPKNKQKRKAVGARVKKLLAYMKAQY